ncbi:MAG: 3-oxoadipate enol-lactonase [candidate division NC10 bacterium]|nr:3-oxoadipate enol-lactonase [candidate division NC10 bacterium]MBI2116692.1 3-oxoadipate enol-lactonase [candidate division NC10 bacterium]MBI3084489.1 3-oxoadipate enol-lactonase [candidate division NC10 bacterium]
MKITANGISINCRLEGPASAPVVTLSHSLATNLSMWDPQIPALTSRYRVLRFDTRGHGDTDAPGGAYSLDQLAEDTRALLQALGIARTHFIGLSMGGFIGQILALRYPEMLQSLVLCDTTSRVPPEAKPVWDERIRVAQAHGMEPHMEPTIERWFTGPFRGQHPDVVDRVRAMIQATKPAGYIGCCHAIAALDLTDRLPAIAVPTLVIVGEEDPGTPVAASRTIHERIMGSELVILASASHLSNMEQAEAFNRAMATFLAKH